MLESTVIIINPDDRYQGLFQALVSLYYIKRIQPHFSQLEPRSYLSIRQHGVKSLKTANFDKRS